MKAEIIEWHEGFKNLGFRTYEKNNNVTVFQKEPFLLNNQTATDFNEMLIEYSNLSSFCVNKLDNNINLEIYKEQDTDSHLPKKQREVSEEERKKLIDLFNDESNGITEEEEMELCNIIGCTNPRYYLNAILFNKSTYNISVVDSVRAYNYLSSKYELPKYN